MLEKNFNSGKIIGKFTARKSGNSLSLTIPTTAGISEGQEFVLILQDDGTLAYLPQRINPWHTAEIRNHNFETDKAEIGVFSDESAFGKELS